MGYLKDKSSTMFYEQFSELKYIYIVIENFSAEDIIFILYGKIKAELLNIQESNYRNIYWENSLQWDMFSRLRITSKGFM